MRIYVLRGGYYPHGGGGLLGTFVHSLVSSLGWHAGSTIAHLLGAWLILIAIVAAVWYLAKRLRRARR